MNAEYLTAFLASPPFFFGSYEMPYAKISNALEIGDHAHAVLGSIPLVQMIQPVAGEAVTSKAVLGVRVRYLLAVLDSTYDA